MALSPGERIGPPYRILLFGDLSTNHFEEQLRQLLHVKSNPLLRDFFDRVGFAFRRLLGTLPAHQQSLFPRFTTLIDLLARLGETDGTTVLSFFLLSVYEVAQFIVHFGEGSRQYPTPGSTCIISPCTGGFAAAAVSCSQTISDLVPIATEAVLAAFRTALRSYLVGQSFSESRPGSRGSWSVALSPKNGLGVEEVLAAYANSHAGGRDSTTWVAAVAPSGVTTLSGPPSTLDGFIAASGERLKSRFLDIGSPYHAPHLFDYGDIEDVLSQVCVQTVAPYKPRIPLLSSASGQPIAAEDFTGLLRAVVEETLRAPIKWDSILTSCRTLFKETRIRECRITSFSCNASSMVSGTLAKELGIEVTVEETAHQTRTTFDQPTGRFDQSKIAIVGYSGRFPSAASNEEFWELLRAGRDVHREIPPDRFNWRTHYDPTGKKKNTSRVKHGCFIDEPGLFDARFFNISPREAENMDPAQRLAIMTAYEAMEMAGMVRNRTPSTQQDRVGVFFGTTSDDWREVNSGQNVDTYFIPGGNRAFVPGRISYFFRFSGPSLSIDTACSSSFAAIQAACGYLWRGECDTTIAGGTNVLTNPDNFAGLDRGHFLSTTGNCNAFDDGADGYCRSDAVGSVILKRLEDAEADNDPIFGVISGTNTNHCGQTDSITRPHEGDQSSVFRRIIRYANVDPLDVSYVEMHGTGTQAGDATEMNSVLSVFVPKQRPRMSMQPPRPLYLGSAKANVGHAESASGVLSLIKVLLMMKHSEIPPHCGIKTRINHNYPLDLAERGVFIAPRPTPWRRSDAGSGKRAVFLNNFSAAGGNTAILLEDAPVKRTTDALPASQVDGRSVHIVTVTGKTAKSLSANINLLSRWLEENSSVALPALSYTTTARRMHHNYRAIASGADATSILSALKAQAARDQSTLNPIPPAARTPRVIFVFTGQGSLYHELAKPLFNTHQTFRTSILRLNGLAKCQGFPEFLSLVDGSPPDDKENTSPVKSQLAQTCVQMALADLWRSWGILPAAVVGHSLGEYAALYASGALSAGDVVYLVGTRATLLEKRCARGTHSMLAVKASKEAVMQLLQGAGDGCELACANQPAGHVVAGPREALAAVARRATDAGLETVGLEVPYAFHSAQVDPILDDFEAAAVQGVVYHPPLIPVLSPLLARSVAAGEENTLNASYLARASRGMVNFRGALEAAQSDETAKGAVIWLEIGPHPACGGMIKGTLGAKETTLATLRRQVDAYKTITACIETLYLAGVDLDWNEYHREFLAALEVLHLPRYAWDLKNYWIQYRNDFCLTKGDPPSDQPVLENSKPATYKYLSPAVQRVIEERHGSDKSSIVVESDIFDERLLPLLQGHLVNGAALCPSSLYADIAMTIGTYLLQGPNLSSDTTGLDVGNVKIDKPLIASPTETSHCFRVSATADWSSNLVSLSIFSVDAQGNRTVSHASLDVQVFPRQRWADDWKRTTHLITSRIEALERGVDSNENDGGGSCHKMQRGIVYKLFGALVEYGPEYRGMADVVMDSEALEAVSTVKFRTERQLKGGFCVDARWIDSLGQIAGFIMNANDAVDSKAQVFINHGWERMRLAEPLDPEKTYRAYNRMQLVEKTTYVGDTYILHEGRVVGIYEGVTFIGVPRQVIDRLLPSGKGKTSQGMARSTTVGKTAPANPPTANPAAFQNSHAPKEPSRHPESGGAAVTSSTVLDRILAIVSQEVGVAPAEMTAGSAFADLGVDSLLCLTILARIRDEVGLELPPSLFIDHPTVGDLQHLLLGSQASSDVSSAQSPRIGSDDESQPSTATSVYSKNTSPTPRGSGRDDRVLALLKEIISEETSVSTDELTPSTCLADVGVDSLLSLTIAGKLSEVLGVDIPGTMLMEYDTLQELEKALCNMPDLRGQLNPGRGRAESLGPSSENSGPRSTCTAPTPSRSITQNIHVESVLTSPPHATSVLLSGSPAGTYKTILFLFPDGSGSASSYAALARTFGSDMLVYGLNCPWRKTAEEMTRMGLTMSTMVAKYLVEVRRVLDLHRSSLKPHKTTALALGGWSAGGILALEAVRQLQEAGVAVDKLLLFDSPNPIGLQNPPQRMYDLFDSLGLFGGGRNKAPAWLRAHFDAFIRILDAYEPVPLREEARPETLIVYAKDGICKDPDGPKIETRPDDPREMIWLLENRTDFSAEGWSSLLGRDKIAVKVMDDVNHFTMMDAGPRLTEIGRLATEFLLQC